MGNPFKLDHHTREEAISLYAGWLQRKIETADPLVIDELDRLAQIALTMGKLNLRCYYAPKPCHGDIIKQIILNAISQQE